MNITTEKIKDREKYAPIPELNEEKLQYALSEALKKIDRGIEDFGGKFPAEASENNIYETWENDMGWGQGFWTGILWIAYQLTGDEKYKNVALSHIPSYEKRIVEEIGVDHHDMGFLYIPSCVAAYKLTGDEQAKNAAIMAADQLMTRYHEKGEFIQAWGELDKPEHYRLIIDCMLNIPLLYWATEVTGDEKYADSAYKHFKSTASNILRADGSTFHTFYFDMETGAPLKGVTHQGKSDNSCWARGQAWGIYGFMLTYMYKKNPEALELFKTVANYFLNRMPKDYIPFWDIVFTDGSNEERDSSSAAIAACGLIEGANSLDASDENKELYTNAAKRMVSSLIDSYLTKDIDSNGLLMHAVYAKPQDLGIDECNIWGDYFYMEALARLIKGKDFRAYW